MLAARGVADLNLGINSRNVIFNKRQIVKYEARTYMSMMRKLEPDSSMSHCHICAADSEMNLYGIARIDI